VLQTYWPCVDFVVAYKEKTKFRELLQIRRRNVLQTHWPCVDFVVTRGQTKNVELLSIRAVGESNTGLIQAVSWLWSCVISRNKVS
jgi:hypothetical protein